MIHRLLQFNLLSLAVFLLLAGCAEGPLWRTGHLSPWARQKWQDDEKIATTLIATRADLRHQVSLALDSGTAEQERVAAVLTDIAAKEPVALVRLEAARLLGKLPVPQATEGLQILAKDREISVRLAAVSSLGAKSDSGSAQTLSSLSRNDENTDVRVAATRQLGNFREDMVLDALQQALSDPNPAMQLGAASSLAAMTGEEFGNDIQAWQDWLARNHRTSPPEDRTAGDTELSTVPVPGIR